MTVQRLYAMNRGNPDLWVQHRTWKNVCARVEHVAPDSQGEEAGCVAVTGFGYDVSSGRRKPVPDWPDDSRYVQIAQPAWHRPRR